MHPGPQLAGGSTWRWKQDGLYIPLEKEDALGVRERPGEEKESAYWLHLQVTKVVPCSLPSNPGPPGASYLRKSGWKWR